MDWLQVLIAFALVMAGRRLYWLFLGGVGFAAGYTLASELFVNASQQEVMIIGLVLGFMGLCVALFLQKAAIAVGGFLAGAYVTLAVMGILGVQAVGFNLLIPILGGAIGILMLYALFDLALVVLSSIVGAALVVQLATPTPPFDVVLFLLISVFGIMFQFRLIGKAQHPARA